MAGETNPSLPHPHEIFLIAFFFGEGNHQVVKLTGGNARPRLPFDLLLNGEHRRMGRLQLGRNRADRKNPGVIADIAVEGEDIIDQNRLPHPDLPEARALADNRADPRPAGRRGEIAGHRRRVARQQVPVKQFTAPHPHPDDALMAETSGIALQFAGQGHLGLAGHQQLRDPRRNLVGQRRRRPDLGDLILRLDRSQQPDGIGNIDDFGPGENLPVLKIEVGRQDVQLHAEDRRQRIAVARQDLGNFLVADNRDDLGKRRLGPGPFDTP